MDYWNRSSYKRKNCSLSWPENTAAKIKNCTLLFIALIYVQNSGNMTGIKSDGLGRESKQWSQIIALASISIEANYPNI